MSDGCGTKGRSTTAFIRRSSTRKRGTGSSKSSRAKLRQGGYPGRMTTPSSRASSMMIAETGWARACVQGRAALAILCVASGADGTPGGVCLSSATYEQVRDRVKEPFLDLGEKGLKNIARPVRVFGLGAAATAAVPESAIPPLQRTPVEATPAAPKSESAVRRESILTIFAGVAALLVAAGAVGPW